MATTFGFEAKFYYGTAGSTASSELSNCKDLTLNSEATAGEITSRATGGYKAFASGLKDASVEWEMVWLTDNAGFEAIRDAYVGRSAIALAILDAASGEGLDADFVITAFNRTESLDDPMAVSVTAKPTYVTRAAAWVEAS